MRAAARVYPRVCSTPPHHTDYSFPFKDPPRCVIISRDETPTAFTRAPADVEAYEIRDWGIEHARATSPLGESLDDRDDGPTLALPARPSRIDLRVARGDSLCDGRIVEREVAGEWIGSSEDDSRSTLAHPTRSPPYRVAMSDLRLHDAPPSEAERRGRAPRPSAEAERRGRSRNRAPRPSAEAEEAEPGAEAERGERSPVRNW